MATTVVTGTYLSDAIVGAVEDVTPDLMQMVRADSAFLNAIGFGDLSRGVIAKQQYHQWVDLAYKHNKCVLNTTITSSGTTIVFTAKGFLPYDYISMEGENIKLGANPTSDGVTFTGCTRGVGATTGAAHTAGVTAVLVARPKLEGASASDQGPTHEPSLSSNRCQIFERSIKVSKQSNNTERYGRPGTAYDDKFLEVGPQIKLEIQSSFYAGGEAVAAAPASGTKGVMKGVREIALAASSYTALGGVNVKESNLDTAAEAIAPYIQQDEFNAVLMIPRSQVKVMRNWLMTHIVGDPAALQNRYGVPVRQIDLGYCIADVIVWEDLSSHAECCLFIPQYVKPVTLQGCGLSHEMLAKTGQNIEGLLSFTGCVEVHGEGKAVHLLTGCAV